MVGKRNVAEERFVVIAIKRAPAAVAILHAQQPLNAAAYSGFHALGIRKLHTLQGHQHKSCVVDIRIKIVAILKDPAARLGISVLDLPVARAENLLRQNPIRSLHQCRMIGTHGCMRMVSPSSISNRENSRISRAVNGSSGPWPSAISAKTEFIMAG